MSNFIQKTFGGLSTTYYIRQFLFGLIFAAFICYTMFMANQEIKLLPLLFVAINQLLYPYSRFVYEAIVEYIMGNNVIFANPILFFSIKLMTMALCWACAIFIAPIGLIYLYFYHTKQEKR